MAESRNTTATVFFSDPKGAVFWQKLLWYSKSYHLLSAC